MNPNHTRDINENTPIFLSFELNWDFTHTTPLPPPPCTNWVRLLCRNTLTLCKSLGLIGLNVKIYSRNILHQPTWYFPPWSSHTRTSALSHKENGYIWNLAKFFRRSKIFHWFLDAHYEIARDMKYYQTMRFTGNPCKNGIALLLWQNRNCNT